ncbi:hypothetical protein LP420_32605 [Massilia sp. B-10]|nr:hypothetical protein LP420_32605 [Massilia sp. B-10]UUZ53432.1 hypothetical protein LP419_32180 [Massilia sp. H-1]
MLVWMPGSLLVAMSHIEVEEKNEGRLVLNADGWPFSFERASQRISRAGQHVAAFAAVDSVDLAHFKNGKRFEWWVLSLQLRGGKTLTIGRSTDGAEASLAGASVATITGKQVRALERPGL